MGHALGLIFLILGIVILTLIIIYSMVRITGQSNAARMLQYGRDREYFIYEMLASAFLGGTVLRNLYFPVPTREGVFDTEIDVVCVTRGGIAVIEVKGSKGNIDSPPKGLWTQKYGKKIRQFENPYRQNELHVRAIRRVLRNRGITNVPIRNYVVFTDIHAQFSHKYPWLLRSDNVVDTIERMDDKLILTRRDQQIISAVMKQHKRRRHMTFKTKFKQTKPVKGRRK